jgi:signal peptidase I
VRQWITTIAIGSTVLFFAFVVGFATFFKTYRVPTGAMEPTILIGDRVIMHRRHVVHRGDVIVFDYPIDAKYTFVMRAVGLAGETVQIKDKRLLINAHELPEPYVVHRDKELFPDNPTLPEPYRSRDQLPAFTIPSDNYFVMGDNRDRASDSRYWGTVPHENIRGVIVYVLSPKTGFHRPNG